MNKIQKIVLSIWLPVLVSLLIMQISFDSSYGRLWVAYKSPWIWFLCFLGTGIFLWFFWQTKKLVKNSRKIKEENLSPKKVFPSTKDSNDILTKLTNK